MPTKAAKQELEKHEKLSNAVLIPYHRIRANVDQPRRHFAPEAMADLRASIETHGLLQPLLVRYQPSGYDAVPYLIIAGERRYRASEGVLAEVPCIVREVEPGAERELQLIENIQRQDLTALEEATAVTEMMTEHHLSARAAARRLNVSDGWVNNRLSLLKTGPDVKEVASRVPYAMSSLLLIDTVKDDAEERQELLQAVENGTAHATIKARIEQRQVEKKLEKDSYRAPDTQTQQRANLHSRNGGGSMSRGQFVTTTTPAEAAAQVENALAEIERHIRTLESWRGHVAAAQWQKQVRRISSLRQALEALDG